MVGRSSASALDRASTLERARQVAVSGAFAGRELRVNRAVAQQAKPWPRQLGVPHQAITARTAGYVINRARTGDLRRPPRPRPEEASQ